MKKVAKNLFVLAGMSLIVLLQADVKAEMYVCVDAAGRTQYTNVNNSTSCRPLGTSKKRIRKPGSMSVNMGMQRGGQNSSSTYDHHINRSSRLYNVDPYLIKAVIKAESNFNRYALSKAGAQGLMQLMPATARELRVRNPYNPIENIDGGTRYLRNMLDLFDGNVPLSLAAYNAGPTLVKRIQRIPRIPETMRYVKKVLANYKGYRGYIPKS